MNYTITFATEEKCKSCVVFRIIQRDCLAWSAPITETSDVELTNYFDRRCAGCSEGSWVERTDNHFEATLVTDWALRTEPAIHMDR